MRWPLVKLSEICEIQSGGTPSRNESAYWDGDLPWAKISDLEASGDGYISSTEERITQGGLAAIRNRLFHAGTLLFAMYGSVGKTAIAKNTLSTNQAILGMKPDVSRLNLYYLKYWLNSQQNKFIQDAQGVAQKNLSAGYVRDLVIPLPPLAEQKRLAAILNKADVIRRKRQQAIQLADEFLRSVFLDMFGDPVTNPKGWEVKPLKQLAVITTGNTPPRQEEKYYGNDIEWIKSDNINTPSHFLTEASEYLSKEGRNVARTVREGAILVTCIAGSFDCIGNAAYANREVAFNQQINALTPVQGVASWFLYALILYSKKLIQSASTNSMKGMISKGRMEEIPMICPPHTLQDKFQNIFLSTLKFDGKLESIKIESNDIFNSLSHKAFKGEL